MTRHLSAVAEKSDPSGIEWPALLVAFTAEHRNRSSTPATLSARIAQVRRFARETPKHPEEVTAADLLSFLSQAGWGYRTRKAHRASLVDMFGWAHTAGLLPSNPAAGLPGARDIAPEDDAPPTHAGDANRPDTAAVHLRDASTEHPARAWARAVGVPHAATGRLAASVVAAWLDAGSPVVAAPEGETLEARWSALLDAFDREEVARGLRPATIRTRRHHLNRLAASLAEEPTAVTRDALVSYLSDPAWAPETRRAHRGSVAALFRWAHETGRLPSNPAARLRSVRVPTGVPDPAPETVIRDAINGARPDVRLMILLGSLAGLRAGEIATLHTRNLTEDGIRVVGKGGRSRVVPMHPALGEEVAAYLKTRALTVGYLFTPRGSAEPYTTPHVYRLISKRLPPGVTAHKLRHRFASRSYAGQYNLRAVQELLGHSSPAVTARYVAVPDAAGRDAVLAVPPIPGIEAPDPTRPDRRPTRRG